jgi:S-(hydroxymethyl)glutathione dehydrogenase/alcohol dehydrogenase
MSACPSPDPREVLIRTSVAGLCHSDLHFMEGLYPHPLPAVLGHESAGIVEQVGSDVTYVKPGDHVVTCLSVFCGTCDNCTTGRPVLCTDTTVKMLPGASNRLSWARSEKLNQFLNLSSFAEQMLVHENAIVKIRKDMPLELAALIGCGVITGYGAVVNTAKVAPGETVVVIGCGGVGMAAINGAQIAGAGRVIAVDANPAKLQLATKLGATDIVDPQNGDVVQQVRDLTNGGVHHSFEVLGRKETAEQAFAMLAPGGTATIVGMIPFGQKIEPHGFDFLRERKIQGSSMGSNHFRVDMPRLVEFYMRGKLHLEDWISAKLKLPEINEGFAAMKAGKTVRSVIVFDARINSAVMRGLDPRIHHASQEVLFQKGRDCRVKPGDDGSGYSSHQTSAAERSRRIRARSVRPALTACDLPATGRRSARRPAALPAKGRSEWPSRGGRAAWRCRATPADRDRRSPCRRC